MMRRAMRMGMAGGGQQRVREAQALMAQGRFEDAAKLFSQLSGEAAQRGMIRPAGHLAMQAARVGHHVERRYAKRYAGGARDAASDYIPAWTWFCRASQCA